MGEAGIVGLERSATRRCGCQRKRVQVNCWEFFLANSRNDMYSGNRQVPPLYEARGTPTRGLFLVPEQRRICPLNTPALAFGLLSVVWRSRRLRIRLDSGNYLHMASLPLVPVCLSALAPSCQRMFVPKCKPSRNWKLVWAGPMKWSLACMTEPSKD